MSPDLTELLCQRYPALLVDQGRRQIAVGSCMGASCYDGCFLIIDQLCAAIQAAVDSASIEQPVALQIKEKFGELRFYLGSTSLEAERLVNGATRRSLETCEVCGASGVLRVISHRWLQTRCDQHAKLGSTIASEEPDEW